MTYETRKKLETIYGLWIAISIGTVVGTIVGCGLRKIIEK